VALRATVFSPPLPRGTAIPSPAQTSAAATSPCALPRSFSCAHACPWHRTVFFCGSDLLTVAWPR